MRWWLMGKNKGMGRRSFLQGRCAYTYETHSVRVWNLCSCTLKSANSKGDFHAPMVSWQSESHDKSDAPDSSTIAGRGSVDSCQIRWKFVGARSCTMAFDGNLGWMLNWDSWLAKNDGGSYLATLHHHSTSCVDDIFFPNFSNYLWFVCVDFQTRSWAKIPQKLLANWYKFFISMQELIGDSTGAWQNPAFSPSKPTELPPQPRPRSKAPFVQGKRPMFTRFRWPPLMPRRSTLPTMLCWTSSNCITFSTSSTMPEALLKHTQWPRMWWTKGKGFIRPNYLYIKHKYMYDYIGLCMYA